MHACACDSIYSYFNMFSLTYGASPAVYYYYYYYACSARCQALLMNFNLFQTSSSVPASPCSVRRNSRTQQFSWHKKTDSSLKGTPNSQAVPLVTPCLNNLDLPFVDDDDSLSATPAVEDCNQLKLPKRLLMRGRRHSTISRAVGGSRKTSHFHSRNRALSHHSEFPRYKEKKGEPTHFRWNASIRVKKPRISDAYVGKRKSTDSVCLQFNKIISFHH